MLAHTFAGLSWRSLVGLEDERAAFDRFRAIRRQERKACLPLGEEPARVAVAGHAA
jgi:hypothetical protein